MKLLYVREDNMNSVHWNNVGGGLHIRYGKKFHFVIFLAVWKRNQQETLSLKGIFLQCWVLSLLTQETFILPKMNAFQT